MDSSLVNDIVNEVLNRLENSAAPATPAAPPGSGIFEDPAQAIEASYKAQKMWFDVPKRQKIKVIEVLRQTMHDYAPEFSKMAQAETGMGRVEDKIAKHHNAADATPGIEDLEGKSWSGDFGLVYEDWAPYGVIAAITPSTHPIPVMLNSMIMMIAAGNAAVFSVHPAAKKVSAYALSIFHEKIVENGGPENLITLIKEPSMEATNTLFTHPKIALICATGGPAVVNAAFKSGKKVIAAGPGNPPVLVDETACVKRAAKRIIEGASFDNNILCIGEKEVFVVDSVFDAFMQAMADRGAVRLTSTQITKLEQAVFSKNEKGFTVTNRDFIGKNANVLANAVGLNLGDDVRMLYGETSADNLFVQEEQMMPFLPVVRCKDAEEGIQMSIQAEHHFKHTAMIYSNNLDVITKFNRLIDTDIVVVNGSCLAGNGRATGEAYFSHTIASPTGEGITTTRNFARIRRLAMYKNLQMV